MLVFVISISGKPLMPCKPAKAKKLLKSKRAKIVRYEPLIIQLLFECENQTQDITLGIDAGSKEIGLCATTDKKELYSVEVKLRDDIVKLISAKKAMRRKRRSRKTRYREARFDNRKRKDGWVAPSIRSKINVHLIQIRKVNEILPISKTIVEVANFDIQKIKNPEIQGTDYQQGEMYG